MHPLEQSERFDLGISGYEEKG
ncbi:hypothetical protein Gohar_013293 [Gossypium harknessii]|uniref:Uncharacterized protein n=1 Tax=Gossypium harknessii TaxID=34285 RepID=A0A7J9GZU7_9ROSI|nr:hypothetical protein [Gossypium harknessii]